MNIQPELNILDHAISAAGGVSALAARLELSPNVISNWKARGIPDGWATALTVMRDCKHGVFSKMVTNVTSTESIAQPT